MGSDQPGQQPAALVAAAPGDVANPIVVPNTLWASDSPGAYQSDAAPPTRTSATSRVDAHANARHRAAGARSRSSRPRPTTSPT